MDLNAQASAAGGLNQAYFNNLLQMNGIAGFNGAANSMGQIPGAGNLGQAAGGNSFDLMQLGQLGQLGNMGQYNLPQMTMPF